MLKPFLLSRGEQKLKPLWIFQKGFLILNFLRLLTAITLMGLLACDVRLIAATNREVPLFYLNAMQHVFCFIITGEFWQSF